MPRKKEEGVHGKFIQLHDSWQRKKEKGRGVGAPRPLKYWTLMVVLVHTYKTLAAVKMEQTWEEGLKPDIKLKF